MKSIFTLTLSPTIDKSTNVDHVIAESKLRCTNPVFEPGGGGINVSRAIKKLEGNSTAIYLKGGPTGELLKQLLDKESIEQKTIESTSWTRENFIVVETASNRQYRFGMPGAEVKESEWKQCLEVIKDPTLDIDFLVVSGSTPPGVPDDFYSSLSKIIKEKGGKLILDTSGGPLKHALQEGIFLLKPNLRELSELAGKELNNNEEQELAAMEIINKGQIEILAVSLGAAGAMMASKAGIYHVSAPSATKKSTVGAGDSMVAGMVSKLAQDADLLTTLQYGVACGTAATMNSGTELCNKKDVNTLFKWISEKYRSTEKQTANP